LQGRSPRHTTEYFDNISYEEQTGVTIDIDFFDIEYLAAEIVEIIQEELGLEGEADPESDDKECAELDDGECTEPGPLQSAIMEALEKLTDSYSYGEIIKEISTVCLQCAGSFF